MVNGYESKGEDTLKEDITSEPQKILKVWKGVTSGSYAGRDDGHPETKYVIYDSIRDVATGYGKQRNERYYKLTELSNSNLDELVKNALEVKKEKMKAKKKIEVENKIKKLQAELRDLQR